MLRPRQLDRHEQVTKHPLEGEDDLGRHGPGGQGSRSSGNESLSPTPECYCSRGNVKMRDRRSPQAGTAVR